MASSRPQYISSAFEDIPRLTWPGPGSSSFLDCRDPAVLSSVSWPSLSPSIPTTITSWETNITLTHWVHNRSTSIPEVAESCDILQTILLHITGKNTIPMFTLGRERPGLIRCAGPTIRGFLQGQATSRFGTRRHSTPSFLGLPKVETRQPLYRSTGSIRERNRKKRPPVRRKVALLDQGTVPSCPNGPNVTEPCIAELRIRGIKPPHGERPGHIGAWPDRSAPRMATSRQSQAAVIT